MGFFIEQQNRNRTMSEDVARALGAGQVQAQLGAQGAFDDSLLELLEHRKLLQRLLGSTSPSPLYECHPFQKRDH
jgi:hypothetical protein